MRDAFFTSHHEREEAVFLGDVALVSYLEQLSHGRHQLVLLESRETITRPEDSGKESFWQRRLTVTDIGREVLQGRQDWITLNPIDRWWGGVNLAGDDPRWRWDERTRALEPTEVGT